MPSPKFFKNTIALMAVAIFLVSCKSKQVVSTEADTSASAKEIIKTHYEQNTLDFKTLHIKGSTKYGIISPSVDLRIKKDEIILVSIRVPLAGTIIKAKATPTSVSYYNNLQSEYFEGDYDFISNFLGTELNFQKLQNLLLGRALDDLNKERLMYEIEKNLYKLSSNRKDINKAYYLEPNNFRLVKQFVEQKHENRSATVEYSKYKNQNNNDLPYSILINSLNKNDANEIKVEYKSIEFNTDISFPFQIPDGFKEIQIN